MGKIALLVLIAFAEACAFANDNLDYGIPKADSVVDRIGYALGYSEEHEQAAWVMYRLTREEVLTKAAKRTDDFREDPNIPTFSALPSDYSHSGFDRGHLAPAEDMKFSDVTMQESFYMSNMSPQRPEFNRGIWKKLEKQVRRFAYNEGSVFVITGPILERNLKKIGNANKVSVPRYFYKVVYDETPPHKMIAFVLPNEGSDKPVADYVTSVDEVERRTGLDFFRWDKRRVDVGGGDRFFGVEFKVAAFGEMTLPLGLKTRLRTRRENML